MKLKSRSKISESKKWGEQQKQKPEVQLLDAALLSSARCSSSSQVHVEVKK